MVKIGYNKMSCSGLSGNVKPNASDTPVTGGSPTGASVAAENVTGGSPTGASVATANVTGGSPTGASVAAANVTGGSPTGASVAAANVTGGSPTGTSVAAANVTGGSPTGASVAAANITGGSPTGANVAGGSPTGASAIELDPEIVLGEPVSGKAAKPLNPEDYFASCMEQMWIQRGCWYDHIRFYLKEVVITLLLILVGIAIMAGSYCLPLSDRVKISAISCIGVLVMDVAYAYMHLYTLEGPPFLGTRSGNPVVPEYLKPSQVSSPENSSDWLSAGSPTS